MVSSLSPAGATSISISVTNPNSYSLLAILSIISLSLDILREDNSVNSFGLPLYGKAFPAATSPRGVGVIESQSLTIQSAGIIKLSAIQVQEALHIHYNLDTLVLKDLVAFLFHGIEIQLVFQSGTPSAFYANPQKRRRISMFVGYQLVDIF